MTDNNLSLENPSRRKLFQSRTRKRTSVRQGIAKQGEFQTDNLSEAAIVPPFAVRVLTRMGFGLRRTELAPQVATDPERIFSDRFGFGSDLLGRDDVAYFQSLGPNDDLRLERYVDEQLRDDLPDPEWESRKAAYPNSFDILDEDLATTFSERECQGFNNYAEPQRQVERAAFTRACYSRRQLHELMVDFWHNHFNIFSGADEDTYVSWADWDKSVIRDHSFGNFHDMVQASAKHPAMLQYLDNYANEAGGFNENYARELYELHTLGAINYLGNSSPLDAPALPTNPYAGLGDPLLDALQYGNPSREIQSEYTDDDVYEAARALTGWRYDDQNVDVGGQCVDGGSGAFQVDESDHDGGGKAILSKGSVLLPSDGGAVHDGEVAIKLAAYHPGTARYIALKLCQRLIADDPPESLVQAAADTFYANRLHPRQIALTLRTILLSDEFKDPATWGKKIKRPFEYIVSAMRAARCDYTWRFDDSDTDRFLGQFDDAGQRLYWWRTPDGYPDERAAWMGSNTLVQNWRIVDWLVDENNDSDANRVMRILDTTLENLPGNPTPRELVAFWCEWALGFTPEGGWVGPIGTFWGNEPTELGKVCMQFVTQQGFPVGEEDAPPFPPDQQIPRSEFTEDNFPQRWHRRLRGVVQLILWSPNFMQR